MSFIKEIITERFSRSSFQITDPIPLDKEIEDFIYELNKCPGIITTNSCAGHPEAENNGIVHHPYLAFLLNSSAWDIFWLYIMPDISGEVLVHIHCINEFEKTSIVLRAHFEDKTAFWVAVKKSFRDNLTKFFV